MQAAFEMIHKASCFADAQLAFANGLLTGHAQPFQELIWVVFHHFQHFGVGVATNNMIHLVLASWG